MKTEKKRDLVWAACIGVMITSIAALFAGILLGNSRLLYGALAVLVLVPTALAVVAAIRHLLREQGTR